MLSWKKLGFIAMIGMGTLSINAHAHGGHGGHGGVTDYVYPATSTIVLSNDHHAGHWNYVTVRDNHRPRMTKKRRRSLNRIQAINERQIRQSNRINRAYNKRRISHYQYKKLRREQARIQRQETRMRHDNFLSKYEYDVLWQKLNRANRNIKQALRYYR